MRLQEKQKVQVGAALAFVVCAIVAFGHPHLSWSQSIMQAQFPTSAWRPNREIRDAHFVGNKACAACHSKITAKQEETAMARALEPPSDCRILSSHAELTFRSGPFTYKIIRQGSGSLYTVSDGTRTISEPVLFCFGQGKAGQTYLFRHGDSFYESRVSFYNDIQNLDYTIGYTRNAPPTLEEAAGRAISGDEARGCFSCHATASTKESRLQLDQLMPGVGCEACHGPGEKHALAMKADKEGKESFIFNPARLDADDLAQEFCGACHRGVEQVTRMPGMGGGVHNVRFQPYRLFNSRAHDPADARLSCTACHDPHDHLRREVSFYDSKCAACHLSGKERPQEMKAARDAGRTAKACPVSKQDCVSCHMPKVEIPGSHFKFSDHRIRIVRPDEPYPN
ncbi:MAG: hypothetical protein QOD00_2955 [Blastocatellia bacterium]|jgi:hypothetical protein|nr:hypothetical protein [Blastocatellia bacterium]